MGVKIDVYSRRYNEHVSYGNSNRKYGELVSSCIGCNVLRYPCYVYSIYIRNRLYYPRLHLEVGDKIMLSYMCGIMVNYFGFVNTFVGLDFVIGVALAIAGVAFVYKLGHVKNL